VALFAEEIEEAAADFGGGHGRRKLDRSYMKDRREGRGIFDGINGIRTKLTELRREGNSFRTED
jgi:hypothetical protein